MWMGGKEGGCDGGGKMGIESWNGGICGEECGEGGRLEREARDG